MSRSTHIGLGLRSFDWILVAAVLILSMVGMAAIYSVDLSRGEDLIFFPTQLLALSLGFLAILVLGFVHISFFESQALLAYLSAFFLLVLVLFFGQTIRGTTGWFRVAGFSFQPAEFAKLALILFLGWRIERQGRRFDRWQFVLATGFMTFLLVGLIIAQPDLGSAAILAGIWFSLLLVSRTKKRYIVSLVGFVVLAMVLGWFFFFQDYQKERLLTFLNPERDPLGAGYNVSQSIIAVGSGKWLGRGLGFGSQSQLHFLPEAQTDFIFSVIGEELGFMGALLLLLVYSVLLWRLVHSARICRSDFGAYTVLGIALMFLLQLLVNIGAAIGMLPVTGVTLPFVSYGGSSLLINCLLIGIAQSALRSSTQF
ncbi:MAG: rod shape-determining protein RodA [Candidatus Magasanikbacteria bacterium]|nr:rod shape-determining protein RodA [Candidatus Magasanikbacteria bacterium]